MHTLEPTATSDRGHRSAALSSTVRSAIACVNCAATKTRCDREYPCGRCLKRGLTCVSRQRRSAKSARATSIDDSIPQTVNPAAPVNRDVPQLSAAAGQSSLYDSEPLVGASAENQEINGPLQRQGGITTPNPCVAEIFFQSPGLPLDEWDTNLFNLGWTPDPQNIAAGPLVPASAAEGASNRSPDPLASRASSRGDASEVEEDALLIGDWKHWSMCRCNPVPITPAQDRTKSSIVRIDHNFIRPGPWTGVTVDYREKLFEPAERFANVPLSETTREWLLMMAQRFMHIAMDVHGLNVGASSPTFSDAADLDALSGYVRLPPSDALRQYLETVLRKYEPFYPLIPARILEPNQLVGARQGRGSSLLLFLMFAFGAGLDPAIKAQRFSMALTEICRHSIQDVLEKDSGARGSGLLFYCSLMFIIKSVFSGDKAHMNIAVAHRHMYLSLMRSVGLFKRQDLQQPTEEDSLKRAWQLWVERESVSRLAYGWVIVENEISLFYDSQTLLNVSELEAILPADEDLWLASTAEEWQRVLCKGNSTDWRMGLKQQSGHSLRTLFQLLLEDQVDCSDFRPNILHMRLLLCPLHVLVTQLGQLLDCGLGSVQTRSFASPIITQNSSLLRFSEIQLLLNTWHSSFEQLSGQGARFRAMENATLTLYHLISLNLYAAFGKMERFARECYSTWKPGIPEPLFQQWLRAPEYAIVHCGQIFRLFHEIQDELRPIWSAAAMYRATIVLWAFGISHGTPALAEEQVGSTSSEVAINTLLIRDELIQNYLRCGNSRPVLTLPNEPSLSMADPKLLLTATIRILTEQCLVTSFSAGVKFRLGEMVTAWEETHKALAKERTTRV
ncbi:hypothetical protein H2200_013302 [Cladophialophora chaetospira]|uniref:Zn(2)-C6 fungal-type domain-containing protein n=1 Tax=Cladophialophora chaetospira TaxID=386627 RepID=A0AA39CBA2_9EURO|nr:hypothetical protein H2200_013302 [Cladophialophora chaetospira]